MSAKTFASADDPLALDIRCYTSSSSSSLPASRWQWRLSSSSTTTTVRDVPSTNHLPVNSHQSLSYILQQQQLQVNQQRRSFHATNKQEIVPFVAVGAVLLIGRYSWKALNRMDEEWEDYLWRLQQYEREKRTQSSSVDESSAVTIGVDLGTIYLKLSAITGSQPELIETSQGDRYRFNGILEQQQDGNDDTEIVTGKTALEKFYYDQEEKEDSTTNHLSSSASGVVLPYNLLQGDGHNEAVKSIQKIFIPSVGEAMERIDNSNNNNDDGDERPLPQNVRTVLTLPPTLYNQHGETFFQNYHDGSHKTVTVPEPVATLWGAQVLDLIPTPKSKEENRNEKTLVIDVGGLASTVSIVAEDMVTSSVCLDRIGGESFVQVLSKRILTETGYDTMIQDPMSMMMISTNARSSVIELVNKTQTNVVIPFLFMGRRPDDPNLNMNVSRTVLEQAVEDEWNTSVIPHLMEQDDVLSSSLPKPTNAVTLFTSAITRVLEESYVLPTDIQRILVVGGGSKHRLLEDAVKDAVFAILGPDSSSKLVLPETSKRAELTALGAASLLPNFDYDYNTGLERT